MKNYGGGYNMIKKGPVENTKGKKRKRAGKVSPWRKTAGGGLKYTK